MRINNSNNNLLFQKKLKANCTVIKRTSINQEEPVQCSIYRLERGEDMGYFRKHGKNCSNMFFYDEFRYALEPRGKKEKSHEKVFVIEDEKGKCLACAMVLNDKKDNTLNLDYLENTVPKGIFRKKYKYVGETLITYLAQRAKNKDKTAFAVPDILFTAKKFYKKCFFDIAIHFNDLNEKDGYLYDDGYRNLLEQNKGHTSEIEFL